MLPPNSAPNREVVRGNASTKKSFKEKRLLVMLLFDESWVFINGMVLANQVVDAARGKMKEIYTCHSHGSSYQSKARFSVETLTVHVEHVSLIKSGWMMEDGEAYRRAEVMMNLWLVKFMLMVVFIRHWIELLFVLFCICALLLLGPWPKVKGHIDWFSHADGCKISPIPGVVICKNVCAVTS